MENTIKAHTANNQLGLGLRDKASIWHPYTQARTAPTPIPIVRGEGARLYTEDGSYFIDGISSWWVNLHGHAHPYIAKKISEQAYQLEHVIFAEFTHPNAVELAERLLEILPGNMSKIFYTDNGSTAIEVALKMAFQFWHNADTNTRKRKVICFNHGYHGDTFGAMSAAGKNAFNKPFWPYLFHVESIDPPFKGSEEKSLNQLKALLQKEDCACFIFEPLVQGAGGMKMHSPEGLSALLALCKEHDVITIADEVMTGFGRTGPLFASEALTQSPAIICLSKGLTGGFLPLGVTACSERIYERFLSFEKEKSLLHGHSYTANPLACTAALASLDLLKTQHCTTQRIAIEQQHRHFQNQYKSHPSLIRCDVRGTILAIEYKTNNKYSYFNSFGDELYQYFLQIKILLRPLGQVLYVLPPYCIEESELQTIYTKIISTLEKI